MCERFTNPYNFVSLGEKVERKPYEKGELSGSLRCTINVHTPLFITGDKVSGEDEHCKYQFFRTPDEVPTIPATSIKGAVRSVFETITNSCMCIMDSKRKLVYRDNVGGENIRRPAIVLEKEEGLYLHILNGYEGPYEKKERFKYLPFCIIKDFYQKDRGKKNWERNEKYKDLKHGDQVIFTQDSKVEEGRMYAFHTTSNVRKYNGEAADRKRNEKVGYICITNRNMNKKKYERIFIEYEKKDKIPDIPLSKEQIQQYNNILNNYYEINQGQKARQGLEQSRFIKSKEELEKGSLVYVEMKQSNGKDSVIGIYPVEVSRKAYKEELEAFIDEQAIGCKSIEELCPACRLFGWVNKGEGAKDKLQALAGRIFFEDAKLIGGELKKETRVIPELASPKLTTTSFYLKGRDNTAQFIPKSEGYNNKDRYKIRGRKFYLNHPRFIMLNHSEKNNRNRSICEYVDRGAKFSLRIDFENLTKEELITFIGSLQLKENMYHRLGYAKPMGLGSITIEIDKSKSFFYKEDYTSFTLKKERISDEFYTYEINNRELESILNNTDKGDICYPYIRGNRGKENFKWFKEANKKRKYLPLVQEDMGLNVL